jgi:PAS domain S-box-containing protein
MRNSQDRDRSHRATGLAEENRALRQMIAHFSIAADAAGMGLWTYDVAADALEWDGRMRRLYGLPASSGPPSCDAWLECVHPEDRCRAEGELRDALAGSHPLDTEFRVVHPDGSVRFLRSTASPSRTGAHGGTMLHGADFDVTARKRADEQFRRAIDAAPTGMVLLNHRGAIVLVNAQIETLFGYARGDLMGRQIEMLVPERYRPQHPDLRRGFLAAPTVRTMGPGRELYGLRKDGTEVPIEIGLNPLQTSDGDFVLSSIVDLSHRREMERMRSDFVSTVSHELRTPLTSISGSLGLLQAGALGVLPDKAAAMVDIAHKNCARLVRMINDILDIGRIEAGQLTLHPVPVSIAELLRQTVEANTGYAETNEVRLRLERSSADDWVIADPDRLMQVFTNLLANAAKFSAPGAEVWIRVHSDEQRIRIEVQDFGAGIPEEFKDRIFQRFAQADASATRHFEGTGLGLNIARNLVEAMGGTIGYVTDHGRGTTFHVVLPRCAVPLPRPAGP